MSPDAHRRIVHTRLSAFRNRWSVQHPSYRLRSSRRMILAISAVFLLSIARICPRRCSACSAGTAENAAHSRSAYGLKYLPTASSRLVQRSQPSIPGRSHRWVRRVAWLHSTHRTTADLLAPTFGATGTDPAASAVRHDPNRPAKSILIGIAVGTVTGSRRVRSG